MTKPPLICHWIEHDRNGKVVGRRFHRVQPDVVEAVATAARAKVSRGSIDHSPREQGNLL